MYSENHEMGSVKKINQFLADEHDIEIKDAQLLSLMHKNLGMKYKKIKPISHRANDDKNLILR